MAELRRGFGRRMDRLEMRMDGFDVRLARIEERLDMGPAPAATGAGIGAGATLIPTARLGF